jgi:hypothetical protein
LPVDSIGGDQLAAPIHWAARQGNVQMTAYLVSKGADPNRLEGQGYNCLHLATHGGHVFLIAYLISIGCHIDSVDTLHRTSLMWCAYMGNSVSSMNEILANNPAIDMVDQTGYTALHWAVISGHYEFAKILLQHGAKANVKDPAGKTPQMWAHERNGAAYWTQILAQNTNNLSKISTTRILYLIPFVLLPLVVWLIDILPYYYSFPVIFAVLFITIKFFIGDYLLNGDPEKLAKSPLLGSLVQSSIFYILVAWTRTISGEIS